MVAFVTLQDSPMFHDEIRSLEKVADELKVRCQRLYKGCHNFMTALGEACNAETSFAKSLEAFGGGQDDPVSVSIGGPVMSKFINVLLELATYKELLRSQVEHVLVDRLMQFMDVDMRGAEESRRCLDKAIHAYDQSRDKFVSLKKNTHRDIIERLEEDLQNSKSEFERSRFNHASSLMSIEGKKKYEFLESISAIMDAHLRYFKLGYDLLSQMEPFIHELLTYTQQSKELANIEQDKLAKRIQEFRTDAELCSLRASSNIEPSPKAYDIHGIGKSFETIMLSAADGEVKTIKQGYLLKRSSLRSDWKRRFFVLDSQGTFYYYKNRGSKPTGFQHRPTASAGYDDGVFATFRSRHGRTLSLGERSFGSTVIDLHTSMIKMDAGDANLRLCFRIVSPVKTYTLQAENAADRMEWVNKISAVIASLLNSHFLQEPCPRVRNVEKNEYIADGPHNIQQSDGHLFVEDANFNSDYVSRSLRGIPGNDRCAECGASGPDWASLNLGILLCIQCSGVHRNLGVHISKVRSLTLDVKVWEPTILDLFHALGNAYCNSIWEGLLLENDQVDKLDGIILSVSKPSPGDTIHSKEKYIHSKYVEKSLLSREASFCSTVSHSSSIWQAVKTNNLQEVYRIIVISGMSIINTTFDEAVNIDLYHHIDNAQESELIAQATERKEYDPFSCPRIKDSKEPASCLQGCSLLHLACHYGNPVMLELLLQFGAHINRQDFHGRTPLHHCISGGNYQLAKFLLRRGASSLIRDGGGLTALDRAMEMGAITDEELFIMLA